MTFCLQIFIVKTQAQIAYIGDGDQEVSFARFLFRCPSQIIFDRTLFSKHDVRFKQ